MAGAAVCPASAGADSFGPRFFQPVVEDRLGMRRGPAVGQHFCQTQVIRIQAEQKVADVDPGLDAMTLGAGENGEQNGGSRARLLAAKEQPILSANGLVS